MAFTRQIGYHYFDELLYWSLGWALGSLFTGFSFSSCFCMSAIYAFHTYSAWRIRKTYNHDYFVRLAEEHDITSVDPKVMHYVHPDGRVEVADYRDPQVTHLSFASADPASFHSHAFPHWMKPIWDDIFNASPPP